MSQQSKHAEMAQPTGHTRRRTFWLIFMGSAVFSGLLTLNAIELLPDSSSRLAQAVTPHAQVNRLPVRPGHVLAGHVAQEAR